MYSPFDPLQPNAEKLLNSQKDLNTTPQLSAEDIKLSQAVFASLRSDLVFQKQTFKHEEYYVIKDPLSLNYFRLQREEVFLISLLDGKRNLGQIQKIFSKIFPHVTRSYSEIAQFFNQLGQAGLLNITAQGFLTMNESKHKQTNFLFVVWVKLISKLLFFKIPLHDPSKWLGKFVDKCSFLWSKAFVWGCIAFFLFTFIRLFGFHWETLSNTIPRFFVPSNIFLIWITMIFIKTFHEFGHAMTCRFYGGEVHEMGVCMICFFLCGYVDASDAWMMRKQSYKIYTTVAGIFTEFIIASILAHIWLFLSDGLLKDLVFNGMVIASINTVMFNMNPLMKFDGYYIISDALQIPNLRTKAITYISFHVQRILFGYKNMLQEKMVSNSESGKIFIIYALASYVYMAFIIYSLSQIFARFLEPYGLKQFGLIIGVAAQGTFLLLPVFRAVYDGFRPGAHIESIEPLYKRLTKSVIAVIVFLIILFNLPTYYRVNTQGVLIPSNNYYTTSFAGGVLGELYVKTGDKVRKGQLLAKLDNHQKHTKLVELKKDLAMTDIFVRSQYAEIDTNSEAQIPRFLLKQESIFSQYTKLRQELASLTILSPLDGIIITPDTEFLLGKYFSPEEIILQIGDFSKPIILIPLKEDDVEIIQPNAPLQLTIVGNGEKLNGRLNHVYLSKANEDEYEPFIFKKFGGPLDDASFQNIKGAPEKVGIYFAEGELINYLKNEEISHVRMKVVIQGQRTTIGAKLWRIFLNFWNLKGPTRNPFTQVNLDNHY